MINRHRFLVIVVVCCLLSVVFIVTSWLPKTKSSSHLTLGNRVTIAITIADTDETRTQGYSNHDPITDTEGMLFTFPYPTNETFWMNKMLFDLDFVYVKNSKVIYLVEYVKAPKNNHGQIEYINSPALFDSVLEVKSGFIEKNKVKIGDKISRGDF